MSANAVPLNVFEVLEEEYANLYGPTKESAIAVWLPAGEDEAGVAPRLVEMNGVKWRRVGAGRDWSFRAGHLSDPLGLATEILAGQAQESGAAPAPAQGTDQTYLYDQWARQNLRRHLARLIDGGVLDRVVRTQKELRAAVAVRDGLRERLVAGVAPDREAGLREKLREAEEKARLLQAAAVGPDDDGGPTDQKAPEAELRDELDKLLDNSGLYGAERFPAGWLEAVPLAKGLIETQAGSGPAGEDLRQLNRLLLERAFPQHIEKIHHIRLAAAHQLLHGQRPAALSLSGGGIRSGTFALGLLQGLARHDLLKRFDYLSTVSGGGYIGGWLTAWLHRHPEGIGGVTRDLANHSPTSKIDPDPRPLRHLREYSNFLTPKVGALTADTWAFVSIYLRNLLLNWAIFLPLLVAALMLPRLYLAYTLYQPTTQARTAAAAFFGGDGARLAEVEEFGAGSQAARNVPERVRVAYRARPYDEQFFNRAPLVWFLGRSGGEAAGLYPRHLLLLFGFALGVWALGYIGFNRPNSRGSLRERSPYWRDRSDQRAFLRYCLLPLVAAAAMLTTYWAWTREAAVQSKEVGHFLAFGLAFTFFGWLISTLVLRRVRYRKRWTLREINVPEMLGILAAGLLGGLLFWLVSQGQFGSPVRGYGVVIDTQSTPPRLVSSPLAWTDWTSWTWLDWTTELYVCLAVPAFLVVFWAGTTLFVGLTSWSRRVSDEDREWWARFGAWLLITSVAWAGLCAVVIYGPILLLEFPRLLGAVGGVSGLIAVLAGRSSLTPARPGADDEKNRSKGGAASRLLGAALPLLGLAFLLTVAAGISLLTTGLTRAVALGVADACQSRLDDFDARLTVQRRAFDFKLVPHDLEEFLTNVPQYQSPAGEGAAPGGAAPRHSPYGGFGVGPQPPGAIDSYREFLTPVVPTLVRPTPTPAPGAPPCPPVCPTPAEVARDLAERTADKYTGAQIVHMNVLHHTSLGFTLILFVLAALVGLLLSRLINLNYFSLHGGYRNRMIRAFLGASRPPGQRKPNPFTGFDPSDNVSMHELRPALLDEDDILDQVGLYEALLDQTRNPLSAYLAREDLLKNVRGARGGSPSPTLVSVLRTDLNAALESEAFYLLPEYEEKLFAKGRPRLIRERVKGLAGTQDLGELRGDLRVLLNRLVLEAAYPGLVKPGQYPPPPYRLLHVVNTSLNLVGGEKLAWQQRKAEPFSVSPLHSGCFRLGYRRSRAYGGRDTGGISIGTAAAISGAAASSNMGYYTTSPIISLLLTLFNVRLGWWLGNPGPAGRDTYDLNKPKYSVSPVVHEAFGLTNDRYKYVYLTDGGHFENLAVYEMVLRRCRLIVVSDGAQDGEYRFGDLGNAVRKIRIDLGVPIEFPCLDIYGWDRYQREQRRGMYWAVGRIRYSCVDAVESKTGAGPIPAPDGVLIYIKPALYGDEPRDVLEYRESFPAFPHQSTGDQFFDEPQFESYRALGSFIMDRLCGPGFNAFADVDELIGRAFGALRRHCPRAFRTEDGEGGPATAEAREEQFDRWRETVKDRSYQIWLDEMLAAERQAYRGGRAGVVPAGDGARD
jgi:hypothetical protein